MLIQGDCLFEMQKLKDNSIDLLFCDLPYNQTSCQWDCAKYAVGFIGIDYLSQWNYLWFFCDFVGVVKPFAKVHSLLYYGLIFLYQFFICLE